MKQKIFLEIKDHEGGEDSKLLVEDMFYAYTKKINRNGL